MKSNFPEGKILKIQGRCISLRGDDIDTDRIIPARFLKSVSFLSLGEQVFADDRIELDGSHPFDLKQNQGSSILVVNNNFGCGSSREHAPQALMRWGIRAVIGESFAEIFFGNCLALGIPCAITSSDEIIKLQELIDKGKNQTWILDVKQQMLKSKENLINLRIDQGPLEMLSTGNWDATSQLIAQTEKLDRVKNSLPYLNKFNI